MPICGLIRSCSILMVRAPRLVLVLEVARNDHSLVAAGHGRRGAGTDLSIMKLLTLRDHGGSVPALPSWLIEPLWGEFAALIGSDRPEFDPTHPWGCHRRRISDRVVFDHVVAALVHGSGYERIATPGCSDCGSPMIGEASAIRGGDARGTEAIRPGVP